MPADTTDTTSPVQAPGGAATPPASSSAAIDPGALKQIVLDAMEAREQAANVRAAKTATDPLAAANARIAELEAAHEAALKKATTETAAARDRFHSRARLLERSGCVDADAALKLAPELLDSDDADAALAAVRKARPYLFKGDEPSTAPNFGPRTTPATPAGGNATNGITAEMHQQAKAAGISVENLQRGMAMQRARNLHN